MLRRTFLKMLGLASLLGLSKPPAPAVKPIPAQLAESSLNGVFALPPEFDDMILITPVFWGVLTPAQWSDGKRS